MKKMINVCYSFALLGLCMLFLSGGCKAKTKEDLLKEGVERLNAGDASSAIVLLKNSLEKDQNYFEARRQLAKAYLAAGKYGQAERELRKVLMMNPSQSDAHLDLSRVYLFSTKPDEALKEAEWYLHVHQDSPEAFDIIGRSYLIKNDLARAEDSFLQAIKAAPGDLSPKLGLAVVYLQKKDELHAKDVLDEVISKDNKNIKAYYLRARLEESVGSMEKALEAYKRITEINPDEKAAIYSSGLIHVRKGDWDKAGQKADLLLKKFPQKPAGYTLKGMIYFRKKNFADAIIAFRHSIKIEPTVVAYYFLGLSLYNKGELEQALSQFNRILDGQPSFVQARLMRGVILLTQKRLDDAIAELASLLQADGDNAFAYNMLGSAYIAKGMYDEAMKALDSAIRIDPTLINAYMKKGAFDIARGDQKEAELQLKTAVKVSPDLLNTRLALAAYYIKRKIYAKAIASLKEGIAGKKTDAPLYNYMALALFSEKKMSEAVSLLVKAKEADPDYFPPYFNLATYYFAKGDNSKGLKEYDEVLKREPRNVSALVHIAISLELWGKDEDALAYYRKAKGTMDFRGFLSLAGYYTRQGDFKEAMGVLDEAIKSGIGKGEALRQKGRLYLSQKMYQEAAATFEKLEEVSPGKGFPLVLKTFILARDYAGALRIMNGRLREYPDDVRMRAELVNVHIFMKDWQNALNNANMIIGKQPDSAFGYTVLATVYQNRNNLDAAVDTLKKGLQVDRKNLQAQMKLGELYSRKKDYTLALRSYEEAARDNPLYFQAVFAQGVAYDLMGKKREAVQKYREVYERAANYVPALNNLAYLLLEGYGDKEEALELAIRANWIEPMNSDVLDTMGYALLKNGRKDSSLSTLKRAATLVPENPSIRYHLALAYNENGQKPLAIENLKKSLQLGGFPDANNAVTLLAKLNAENDRRVK